MSTTNHRAAALVAQLMGSTSISANPTSAKGKFAGQVAVVTGGAGGIGIGIAKSFVDQGAQVVLVDMSEKALKKAQGLSGAHAYFAVNVTSEAEVNGTTAKIVAQFGGIDILVQSAGVTGKTGIKTHEVDTANFQFVYDVNVKGLFMFCKAVLPHMLKKNYGRIVNIASISGKEGNAGMLAYSSSKAAVIGLTKVIGKEYAHTGITCNCLAPAVVRTPMVAAMPATQVKYMTDKIPMKRCGEIEEIANTVSYIASKEASFTTAFCYDATGGRATY